MKQTDFVGEKKNYTKGKQGDKPKRKKKRNEKKRPNKKKIQEQMKKRENGGKQSNRTKDGRHPQLFHKKKKEDILQKLKRCEKTVRYRN